MLRTKLFSSIEDKYNLFKLTDFFLELVEMFAEISLAFDDYALGNFLYLSNLGFKL